MNGNKKIYKSLKYITMLTQLGISVMSPLIICIFVSIWLKNRYSLGDWAVLAGILLGIASGLTSFWNYIKKFTSDMQKEQEEYKKSLGDYKK